MKENLLIDKSIAFASRIIKLHQYLIKTKKETIISKQIVRSGTSIGANINEANYGQSKADFISKMHIALKETAETEYWLKLLTMSEYITDDMGKSLLNDCLEIKTRTVFVAQYGSDVFCSGNTRKKAIRLREWFFSLKFDFTGSRSAQIFLPPS